jgi:hypothetical protein
MLLSLPYSSPTALSLSCQVASKFTHQMSLLSGRSIERALEDALLKNKNASKFTERSFQDAIFSLGLVLSGCACRCVFSVLDPEGRGTVTVDSIIDFISKGKAGHERRDRDGAKYVYCALCNALFYLLSLSYLPFFFLFIASMCMY